MADIVYWCIYPDGSTPDPTASEIVGETYASATAYGNDTGPGVTTADFTGAAIAGSYSGDYRIAAVWFDGVNYSNVAISDVISVIGPEGIVYWCIYPDGSIPDPTASEIVGETYASATAYGNDTGPGVTTADFTGAAIAGSYSGDYRIAAVWSDGTNYSNVAISVVVSIGSLELVVANCVHSQQVDNIALTQHNALNVEETTHSQLADVLNLLQANQLIVADTQHSSLTENIELTAKAILAVANSSHVTSVGNIDLTTGLVLNVANVLSAHTVDNLSLAQANILIVNSTEHTNLVDNIGLTEAVLLSISDTQHGQTADNVTLSNAQLLEIQNILHTVYADNVGLTQKSTLIVSDALHAHLAQNIILPGTFFSAGRLVVVNSIGKRLIYIASHDRIVYIMKTIN